MFESTMKLLYALASLKLTLLGIVALLAGVLLAYFNQGLSGIAIMLPLAVLALNLLAAIVFNPRIRQNSGLLMFHICLLMIAILTLLSQLTSMKGRVEVTQGSPFDADSVTVMAQGAWHRSSKLHQVEFIQGDIEVAYGTGLRRDSTRSQLLLEDTGPVTVGDNVAFKRHGYRFYTTSNKGFAAVVNWHAHDGGVERGAIHFPSFPLFDWKQVNRWETPSGKELAFRLNIETPLHHEKAWLLQAVDFGYLEITLPDGARRMLTPGDSIKLGNARLEFEALRMWMGYKIFYDPWLAWFFAAALVGVTGLAWHYWLKLCSPGTKRLLAAQKAGRGRVVSTAQS